MVGSPSLLTSFVEIWCAIKIYTNLPPFYIDSPLRGSLNFAVIIGSMNLEEYFEL